MGTERESTVPASNEVAAQNLVSQFAAGKISRAEFDRRSRPATLPVATPAPSEAFAPQEIDRIRFLLQVI